MERPHHELLAAAIREFLDGEGIPCFFVEKDNLFFYCFQGPTWPYRLIGYVYILNEDLCRFFLHLPDLPELKKAERFNQVRKLVCSLNCMSKADEGCFLFCEADHELNIAHPLYCGGGMIPNREILWSCIYSPLMTFSFYSPLIRAVLCEGETWEKACQRFHKTAGEEFHDNYTRWLSWKSMSREECLQLLREGDQPESEGKEER